MRGRPPLPLGTWGNITSSKKGAGWQASTYFRLYNGKTVRVRATAKTKSGSVNAVKERCAQRLNTTDTDVLSPTSTLMELIGTWLAGKDDITSQTRDRYQTAIKRHIEPGIGQVRLNEITPPLLDRWIKGVPVGAAHNAMSVLKGAFGMAVRHGLIRTSPLVHIAVPKAKKKPVSVLTADQMPTFRKHIHNYADNLSNGHTAALLRDVVDLALSTGLRLGEILAIRWEDIDGNRIHITGTIVFNKEHGNIRQEWTKTETSTRTVQLGALAQAIVKRRRGEDWAEHADMLFPSTSLTYMAEANFNRLFRQAKGEEWSWVTIHTLRRTVATVINRELGTKHAADLLGHADMALTQRVYIARNDEGVAIGEVIDGILGVE